MIWLDPAEIKFKISPSTGLRGSVAGDWDIERRVAVSETLKYRSMVQHFVDGAAWVDTDLFQSAYARRLSEGESIRGATTLPGLAEQYTAQIDTLFDRMRHHGFVNTGSLPVLLRGRSGEIFIGNQGNHRLPIAHILGLKEFAGVIVCSHP